jgi:GDP-mannose 6-dehydrogenase
MNAMTLDNNMTGAPGLQTRMERGKARLSIFGLGYVGAVSTACFASRGHRVVGVDPDASKVDVINSGKSPIVEAGLGGLLGEGVREGSISATGDVDRAVLESDLSLICVGTPSAPDGGCDLKYLREVSRQIGTALVHPGGIPDPIRRASEFPG